MTIQIWRLNFDNLDSHLDTLRVLFNDEETVVYTKGFINDYYKWLTNFTWWWHDSWNVYNKIDSNY